MQIVRVRDIEIANDKPLVFIGGPCQIESADHAIKMAQAMKRLCSERGIPFIFKSSFDKANRTSHDTPRGVGLMEGLAILETIRRVCDIPVTTDVHEIVQVRQVAKVVDLLQIPAFLCRQTDLLVAAAKTGRPINVKKGQFLAPWEMAHVARKIESTDCPNVLVTERGSCFGYQNLVVDMRSLPILRSIGYPVVFDATHSTQYSGANNGNSGGRREFVLPLARAAVAVGVAAIFAEVHDDPDHAPSDGPCMLRLDALGTFLDQIKALDALKVV